MPARGGTTRPAPVSVSSTVDSGHRAHDGLLLTCLMALL
jgi:hypothetical protein